MVEMDYYFNRIRTCRLHDFMREIIQLKAMDESFVVILSNRRMSLTEKIHRMLIHDNYEEIPSGMRFTSLRSLFCICVDGIINVFGEDIL